MQFKRLISPEAQPNNLDTPLPERRIRILGGYGLGLLGYVTGVGAISNSAITAGLSVPLLGGMSAMFLAGSRALLRPAYQNTDDYEDVKEETLGQKTGRMASFVGGLALFHTGVSFIAAGAFNTIPGMSLSAPTRIASVVAGLGGFRFGKRFIRGSFDPDLMTPSSQTATKTPPKTLFGTFTQTFKDSYARNSTHRAELREQRAENAEVFERQKQAHLALSSEYMGPKMDELRQRHLSRGNLDRAAFRAELNELLAEYREKASAIFTPIGETPSLII